MEIVVERLFKAFANVAANKGAPGPDQQTIEQVTANLGSILKTLGRLLLSGDYRPGDIRRVWIPKDGGKLRGLGIPNVIDRVVQEALRLVLEPLFEPSFHDSSHGFRSGRGCHTAIAEARSYVEQGYVIVVDMDLEKFFDQVHHQRLMARLAQRVEDKRVLVLIGRLLKAKVILPNGLKVATSEGVPQGGPLSPLLSNIVLDELDWELARRGHRFVRYADDFQIYVRSERAGHRTMASIERFIAKRLRLKVNASKSAVARPDTRHFLGFRLFRRRNGRVEIWLSERTVKRIRKRIVELTPRSGGRSLKAVIDKVNSYLRGWLGHFGICTVGINGDLRAVDRRIRRRLRAIQLKHWKRKRTIVRRLIRLGVRPRVASRRIYAGRQSIWALSNDPAVQMAMPRKFFEHQGLLSLLETFKTWRTDHPAPEQQLLFLEL
jgi:group II intron reverse transcriptase/maturase